MGNWLPCCLKASPSPSASPKLGWSSRQVKCESEVHEEAARDTRAMEAVPVTPKSEKLNSGAIKHYYLKNISAPMTPQGKKQQMPSALWRTSGLLCPQSPLGGTPCFGLLPAGASFPRDGHLVSPPLFLPPLRHDVFTSLLSEQQGRVLTLLLAY